MPSPPHDPQEHTPAESPTIAVIGAATPIGRALLPTLEGVGHVVAIDGRAPDMPPPSVELKLMDPRDKLLSLALEGVDVVVHAAFDDDPSASADALYGRNVGGTRNVLAAASKAGVSRLVLVSSTVVYGAHADNPVPLTPADPPRANPGFAYAYQRMLSEELVEEWAESHPGAAVTILRCAPLLDHTGWNAVAHLLTAPRLLVPAGGRPLWQFISPRDAAGAVAHVLASDVTGTHNVAADGWLSSEEVADLLDTRCVTVAQTTLGEALRLAERVGVAPAPRESLPYLTHPWVVDAGSLHDTGWRATRTNRELLVDFAARREEVVSVAAVAIPRAALRRVLAWVAALVVLGVWRLRARSARRSSS